jgi:hypothetical protein
MADPTGEADKGALRLDFDGRLLLQSSITSDARLLAYRELDDTLRLVRCDGRRYRARLSGHAVTSSDTSRRPPIVSESQQNTPAARIEADDRAYNS